MNEMRVLYMANNRVGLDVLHWLIEQGQTFAGVVVHPPERAKFREEIVTAVAPLGIPIWNADRLRELETAAAIRASAPDLILSVLFGYILKPDILSIAPQGAINLHNGYLPYNAGSYANVWSIIERTPAGATLHYIDEGIDTGDIIARNEVPVRPDDTGQSIYAKVEKAQLDLFKETWPRIVARTAPRLRQDRDLRTYHTVADAARIDCIELDRNYPARELLDILRARTFPPHRGAYFVEGGRRYFVSVSIEEAE
jgi:methionyl-tRNA formyltransferase